jgi:SAM-dependent methyltransferase
MNVCACPHPGGLVLTDRLMECAGLAPGASVLDVGCGDGASVARMADGHGLRPVGLDVSEAKVRLAAEARPDLDFVAGRAEALPFADAAFDAVLCECVLSAVDDAGAALTEMRRVLRPAGAVLLSDLYVREGSEDAPGGGVPSLGRRETVKALLAGAALTAEVWGDESGALSLYLWDHAGSGPLPPRTERRPAGAGSGRRLGYFICVARPSRHIGGETS